jgi:hypothetical protein
VKEKKIIESSLDRTTKVLKSTPRDIRSGTNEAGFY